MTSRLKEEMAKVSAENGTQLVEKYKRFKFQFVAVDFKKGQFRPVHDMDDENMEEVLIPFTEELETQFISYFDFQIKNPGILEGEIFLNICLAFGIKYIQLSPEFKPIFKPLTSNKSKYMTVKIEGNEVNLIAYINGIKAKEELIKGNHVRTSEDTGEVYEYKSGY